MNTVKTLALKFLLLAVIIVALNYVYIYTFFEHDLQTHSDVINLVRSAVDEKNEIMYIGESSNTTFRVKDHDKREISSFIGDFFPTKKVSAITKPAAHAGIYYDLLNNIPENSTTKTVIVTLNLRSFNAGWIFSALETSLQKSTVLLKDSPPLFKRFLLSFKYYDIKTEAERDNQIKDKWLHDTLKFPFPFAYPNVVAWDHAMATAGIKNADGNLNQPLTELACHYIKTYAFQIDTLTNPRIKDFDRIVELSKKRNWNLVFNLLAENTQMADSLVGKDLMYLIRQNEKILVERYSKGNSIVVSSLDKVPNEEFIDQNWTTEHYAEKGRKIIAKNVAFALKKLYPNDFKEPDARWNSTSTTVKSNHFFNDCEGSVAWSQMQTLTNEFAFSGKKSSKTDKKGMYSVTFESPISQLGDSLKKVNISFQLFQKDVTDEAALTVDIAGNNIQHHLTYVSLASLCKEQNKWATVNYTYELPSDFNKGDLIKIFVYNKSKSPVYIDNFKIDFLK
ncbi:MAG TPA: DUF4843 domain-containing protein [Bacteroidia bacterium]|nr:DUF4843 domain-containing protein [Bacteroidia bacterium]